MRSPISSASLMEWVMKTAVLPFSFTSLVNSARSFPAVDSSSAENGSSQSKMLALVAKARAIEMRCRMPLPCRHLQHLQPQFDVLDRGTPRQQPVVLEHDRHLASEGVEIGEG